jgi:hypothetical protein
LEALSVKFTASRAREVQDVSRIRDTFNWSHSEHVISRSAHALELL